MMAVLTSLCDTGTETVLVTGYMKSILSNNCSVKSFYWQNSGYSRYLYALILLDASLGLCTSIINKKTITLFTYIRATFKANTDLYVKIHTVI